MFRNLLPLALLAFLPGVVLAHEQQSTAWCVGGQRLQIDTFNLGGTQLEAALEANPPACNGTCGEPDDDYRSAMYFARELCAAHTDPRQLSRDNGDIGDVIAVVTGPRNYMNPYHHSLYSTQEGVSGVCLLCLPISATPEPPGTPAPSR